MDYLLVDVNVHPTKTRVRISKEYDLAKLITQAISQSIQSVQRIPVYGAGQKAPTFKRKPDGLSKANNYPAPIESKRQSIAKRLTRRRRRPAEK